MTGTHGGDWAGYETEYGFLPLDFSANISPLGLPDGVREAAVQALQEADRYPDPLCRMLRARLAERHGIPAAQIVLPGTAPEESAAHSAGFRRVRTGTSGREL